MMRQLLLVVLIAMMLAVANAQTFRFSTVHGDHMVLQRAPKRATVWGFGTPHANVVVTIVDHAVGTTVGDDGKWLAILPAVPAGGPYNISAKSATQVIWLQDVLFGDVWICSGQSNMQFTVSLGNNATAEAADSVRYPNIRFNTVRQFNTTNPLDEVNSWWIKWSVPSAATVGGPQWGYLSGACWFFAKNLYDQYKIPIGLMSTNYGGTAVESWSSPDALAKCTHGADTGVLSDSPSNPLATGVSNSQLWNAMVVPLLKTTIYGAIWYQGEANAGKTNYWCTFPAMVDDWRVKWNIATQGQTDTLFPFGFVQLSTWNANDNSVAGVRWQQTANYGYVPNARQVNYFMAEAMDLGSPAPAHDIHPKNKQDVGYRLSLGGRAIAYGEKNVYWTGPLPQSTKVVDSRSNGDVVVNVVFSNVGARGLELRSQFNNTGFQLQDKTSKSWINAHAKLAAADTVSLVAPLTSGAAIGVRYAWAAVPCEEHQCLVYSAAEAIPAPVFTRSLV